MHLLSFVTEIPEWASKRGLDSDLFDLLNKIAESPDREEQILSSVEYDTRCCLQQALEYGRDKGLIQFVN